MTIYKLKKLVYHDKFNKCYFNTLSISSNPNDPSLNHIVTTISRQKLSVFDYNSACCETPGCLYVFKHPTTGKLLKEQEIDILFSELINAGYTIQYEMSKLIKDPKFICFISK
tara:strand:- start:462 stop:800 length:339 start_codon:yes stop_codon:yes gene_type:complete